MFALPRLGITERFPAQPIDQPPRRTGAIRSRPDSGTWVCRAWIESICVRKRKHPPAPPAEGSATGESRPAAPPPKTVRSTRQRMRIPAEVKRKTTPRRGVDTRRSSAQHPRTPRSRKRQETLCPSADPQRRALRRQAALVEVVRADIASPLFPPTSAGVPPHLRVNRARYRSNCASNAIADGLKSIFRTNAAASAAPCSRSIRLSSHSTESGP